MTEAEQVLVALFQHRAGVMSTEPYEKQPYYPRIQRLLRLADGGLHPRVWIIELGRELGVQ